MVTTLREIRGGVDNLLGVDLETEVLSIAAGDTGTKDFLTPPSADYFIAVFFLFGAMHTPGGATQAAISVFSESESAAPNVYGYVSYNGPPLVYDFNEDPWVLVKGDKLQAKRISPTNGIFALTVYYAWVINPWDL